MGKAFADSSAAARELFEEVDEVLGQSLSRLMFEGPADELTLTANAQPAIMAASLAALRVLEREAGILLADKAAFVAGHSLGEYSALAAAGSLALADTAGLLRLRGEAMQAAVPPGEGAMAAILALPIQEVQAIAAEAAAGKGLAAEAAAGEVTAAEAAAGEVTAAEAAAGEVLAVANDNAPGQVVVSGAKAAVERAILLAKSRGARHTVLLPVSAPFHCPLMRPAAEAMERALAETTIRAPVVPLYANVTAAAVSDPADIRRLLVAQVTGTVRWRESVEAMAAAGVDTMVELGGKVLGPMVKRIAPGIRNLSVQKPDDIDALLQAL